MKLVRALYVLFTIATLVACSGEPITVKQHANTTITVTDFSGAEVTVNYPAQRIIALAPHIVENIYSAGAGENLIGVIEYSNYPEQARSLPLVGSYEKINYEQILQLNPDLIIAWQSGNSHSKTQQLKEMGFTVYIDQPNKLEDIAKSISDIGILTGKEVIADSVARIYLQEIQQLKTDNSHKSPVTAFYQVWNKPLQTINGDHIISSAMAVCGGINIYADEFAVAPIINIESILDKNPNTIIASGIANNRPEWLDDWLQWPSLTAVKNQHLFFINPDHIQRHTLRVLLGIRTFCGHFDQVRQRQKR